MNVAISLPPFLIVFAVSNSLNILSRHLIKYFIQYFSSNKVRVMAGILGTHS